MKIMFIDESDKQKSKENKYYFALVGLLIDDENIILLETSLRELKEKYSIKNFKEIRKKEFETKKIEITEQIRNLLKKYNVLVIAAVLGSKALKESNAKGNNYSGALFFLLERYFIHLQKEDQIGLIIHDCIDKSLEILLRKEFYNNIITGELVMYGKKRGSYINRIYPSIFFSNDEHSEILQVSDLIALALNSAIWKALNSKKWSIEEIFSFNPFLKIYEDLFVKSSKGLVSGWGIKIWW